MKDFRERNEQLAKDLVLPLIGENYSHGASYRLNKYQEIFVRWNERNDKASAILQDSWKLIKDHKNMYFDRDKTSKQIGFSVNKTNDQIVKDIYKRLIDTAFAEESYAYIERRVNDHQKHEAKCDERREMFKHLGFRVPNKNDCYNAESTLYINTLNDGLITVSARNDGSSTLKVSLPSDNEKYLFCLNALVTAMKEVSCG